MTAPSANVDDLSLCARESIHNPGAIQPHGALIAALCDGMLVTHVSANLAAILGRPAEAALGRPLAEAIGAAACRELRGTALRDPLALSAVPPIRRPDGTTLALHVFLSGGHVCVDIEPIGNDPWQRPSLTVAQAVIKTFRQAADQTELCQLVVRGLKVLTGFDRIMAYRFHPDGHGEVIAEARAPDIEPYLGLHYPASDVPPQARALYLCHRAGAVADAGYVPVPLLSCPALDDGTPLDLTASALRSVSPLHRTYMRNMKTAASLTIGLALGSDLWGMLVCHHQTPRVVGPELRAVADMIGEIASSLLSGLAAAETAAQLVARTGTLRGLIARFSDPVPLAEALAAGEADLLRLVQASGALIRISGTVIAVGQTPAGATRALSVLRAGTNGAVLAIDDLGLRHPELADCTKDGSGALLLPLGRGHGEAILWFRPELSRTILWGGNPTEHVITDLATGGLSPRASFAAWKATVRGRCAPWAAADVTVARELQVAIELVLGQRAEAELNGLRERTKAQLARLRDYDQLTGLPNRRLLEDRLTQALKTSSSTVALLFIDLDGFKAINDMVGYAGGDSLLVEVAQRLQHAAATDALAARLGGDEFVVLCPGQDADAATRLGERIRTVIGEPFAIAGRTWHLSASIGVAASDQAGGINLIQAADMAMYAAKRRGGNQLVPFQLSLFVSAAQQFAGEDVLRDAADTADRLTLLYSDHARIRRFLGEITRKSSPLS